ncbi:hypothetical protein K504DRAFT_460710 [Pleomassaria siparia CBS 279.74]|uniref:Uncharacterized protein n=1 Tax=Pleomassaria siparia CBS 279.74 TaxID=1314801 RepID=A0A6G1JXC8_9PLEO|nr:hypothetical protein K504DRAFT_460710 [Pleomassaria siparia CBS 279.74]
MTNDDTSSPFPFLALPRELRDLIYTFYFSDLRHNDNSSRPSYCRYSYRQERNELDWGGMILGFDPRVNGVNRVYFPESSVKKRDGSRQYTHRVPALCDVSRQVYCESLPFYLSCVATIFTRDAAATDFLTAWLETFPHNAAFPSIVAVRMHTLPSSASQQYDFLERCVNLASLRIIFNADDWVVGTPPTLKACHEFAQFDRLLRLPKLQQLQFTFGVNKTGQGQAWADLTKHIEDWVAGRWKEERGRGVAVKHRYNNPARIVFF